jgi:hypothetical protein
MTRMFEPGLQDVHREGVFGRRAKGDVVLFVLTRRSTFHNWLSAVIHPGPGGEPYPAGVVPNAVGHKAGSPSTQANPWCAPREPSPNQRRPYPARQVPQIQELNIEDWRIRALPDLVIRSQWLEREVPSRARKLGRAFPQYAACHRVSSQFRDHPALPSTVPFLVNETPNKMTSRKIRLHFQGSIDSVQSRIVLTGQVKHLCLIAADHQGERI